MRPLGGQRSTPLSYVASVGALDSVEYGDAAREPVDVHFVLAIAAAERDAAAVAAAVRIEADGADLLVDQVLLRGEELELHVARQRMLARVAVHLEPAAREIDDEER